MMDALKYMVILLVDDHDLVLEGMLAVLQKELPEASFETAHDGMQALKAVDGGRIGLVVLDLELPDISGFRLIGLIREKSPGTKVVVCTVHEEIWVLRHLQQCRIDGIVFKSADCSALCRTVRQLIEGRSTPCPTVGNGGVSAKELEVLQLIADGIDSQGIAERLFISVNTVESHRSRLMRKLSASNATDMVMRAISWGLIPPPGLKKLL